MRGANFLRILPPETAHGLAVALLGMRGDSKGAMPPTGEALRLKPLITPVAGLHFLNPLGVAAGFDKNAIAPAGVLGMGFGHVEVGTITPQPQEGNPRPRVFRLTEDNAVINRYGFNNDGMEAAAMRLEKFRASHRGFGIVGVNIGANKTSRNRARDYYKAARRLAEYADYITINVSSPNTPGLRNLQSPQSLAEVIAATMQGMAKADATRPLFLKLSPDLARKDLAAATRKAVDGGCTGLIISNTTTHRPEGLASRHRDEAGGLSGAPLFKPSTRMLHHCRRNLVPRDFALIAAGGVHDGASAYAKIRAGANLVQLYTSLALGYADAPAKILGDLAGLLARDGFSSITEAVGVAGEDEI